MSLQSKQTFHFAFDHYTTCSLSATAGLSIALSCGCGKFCLHLKTLLLCGSACENCTKGWSVLVGRWDAVLCNSALWNDVWGDDKQSEWFGQSPLAVPALLCYLSAVEIWMPPHLFICSNFPTANEIAWDRHTVICKKKDVKGGKVTH